MNTTDLRTLFDYNYWATARIMRMAQEVSPEQFTARNASSYGSLRGKLVHIMRAEVIWRKRLQGDPQPTDLPVEDSFPTAQALYKAWAAEERQMRAYLLGLIDADLQKTVRYRSTKSTDKDVAYQNTVGQILTHVVNHGTQHRAEAAAMLTDFRHSPGDIDLILYYREKG